MDSQNCCNPSPQYQYNLLKNIHLSIPPPTLTGQTYLTTGEFIYFHYNCDNYDDTGWGCAYRTLQSSISWIKGVLEKDSCENQDIIPATIPSILEIQQILVNISDKPASFLGSKEWIGALEVFYVIDTLFDISCKILHIPQREDIKRYANVIKKYFEDYGGLIMMGGDLDASSKGIAGIHINDNQAYLLVIDPHFVGKAKTAEELIGTYIKWKHTSEFFDSSFYNLCLPQIKSKK